MASVKACSTKRCAFRVNVFTDTGSKPRRHTLLFPLSMAGWRNALLQAEQVLTKEFLKKHKRASSEIIVDCGVSAGSVIPLLACDRKREKNCQAVKVHPYQIKDTVALAGAKKCKKRSQ